MLVETLMHSKDPYMQSKLKGYKLSLERNNEPNFLERMSKDFDQRKMLSMMVANEIGVEEIKQKARLEHKHYDENVFGEVLTAKVPPPPHIVHEESLLKVNSLIL